MRIIEPYYKILTPINREMILKNIELAGRTCYKSYDKITPDSASKFVSGIVKSGHESVIEHAYVSVRFVGSRTFTHQLVRHRLANYSQESQRFVNYTKDKFGGDVLFIDPMFNVGGKRYTYEDYLKAQEIPIICLTEDAVKMINLYNVYISSCEAAEESYFALVRSGAKPEEAREVLGGGSKTEIVMTTNLRVWRHIFNERALNKTAQYQFKTLVQGLLTDFNEVLPEIFQDQYLILNNQKK
jgi:thymidylate synthase (FAD)